MRPIKGKGCLIVLRGTFAPQIFQPAWFGTKGLIRQAESDKAKDIIVHESMTSFSLEWANVQVLQDRFTIATMDEGYEEPMRDLVLSTFRLLSETPITAIGLNRTMHFQVEDVDTWHAIGHKLAPKEVLWDKILTSPGTKSLTIEGKHKSGLPGYTLVKIEPSVAYQNSVYAEINDHYIVGESGKGTGADMAKLLEDTWADSQLNSNTIMSSIRERL